MKPNLKKYTREMAETERWFFIAKWCKKRGVSPMNETFFNQAAAEWAFLNSQTDKKID